MTDMPIVASANDLQLSIRYADEHPEARWYVIRRAVAFGEYSSIPDSWSATGLISGVVASLHSHAHGAPIDGTRNAVRAAYTFGDPSLNVDVLEILRTARRDGVISLDQFEELATP